MFTFIALPGPTVSYCFRKNWQWAGRCRRSLLSEQALVGFLGLSLETFAMLRPPTVLVHQYEEDFTFLVFFCCCFDVDN